MRNNQTVTEKFEQCCKVSDNTVMVVIFTVDVNNEIIQMKYNVPSQKRPCLPENERVSFNLPPTIQTPCILWIGVFEWSHGLEYWSGTLGGAVRRNLLPTPSSWFRWHFQFYFVKKETDKADVFSKSLFSLIN